MAGVDSDEEWKVSRAAKRTRKNPCIFDCTGISEPLRKPEPLVMDNPPFYSNRTRAFGHTWHIFGNLVWSAILSFQKPRTTVGCTRMKLFQLIGWMGNQPLTQCLKCYYVIARKNVPQWLCLHSEWDEVYWNVQVIELWEQKYRICGWVRKWRKWLWNWRGGWQLRFMMRLCISNLLYLCVWVDVRGAHKSWIVSAK